MSEHKGWIAVDLDGTLAHYDGWKGIDQIGDPVPAMLCRVLQWLALGQDVRIFTARVSPMAWRLPIERDNILAIIDKWSKKHIGVVLPVTHEKDLAMIQLWDDRCVQIIPNTGLRADGQP
jgi:hypothetical protein